MKTYYPALCALLACLAGCAHNITTPPPPVVTHDTEVVFSIGAIENPFAACAAAAASSPCNVALVITDTTANIVVATLPIGTVSYTLTPAPALGSHTYSLVVPVKNPDGTVVESSVLYSTTLVQ